MAAVSGYAVLATAGTPVLVLSVHQDYEARLKAVIIHNPATAAATVDILNGDGTNPDEDYVILRVVVPAGQTLVLGDSVVGGLTADKDVYARADQAGVTVTVVAEVA